MEVAKITQEEKEVLNKLKYLINKKKSLEDICDILGLELYQVYELVLRLKELGQNYDIVNRLPVKIIPNKLLNKYIIMPQNTKQFCFVSDLHYGSKADRPDIIRYIYSECDRREIDTIFCAGDVTDGYYPRRPLYATHQKIIGAQSMKNYVLHVHPYSKYIKFYTIGGNHDGSFKDSDGIDILAEIAKEREDIIYLGMNQADITIGKTKIKINHGYGKTKNLYERTKKYYESLDINERPDILELGHVHHSFFTKFADTYIFQTAALIDMLDFADDHGFSCERSCWFAKVEYDNDGKIAKVLPEISNFGPHLVRTRKYY